MFAGACRYVINVYHLKRFEMCYQHVCVCHKISLNAVYKVNIFDSPSLNTWLLGIVIHRTEVLSDHNLRL